MFLFAATVLTQRVSIYLFAFLVIQVMVLITTFEFIRKPWEGLEQEAERVMQETANNMFGSISSYDTKEFSDNESNVRGLFKPPAKDKEFEA
jgi:hypothetical protein